MGVWDSIKDWFTKEEAYKFDEEKRAKQEKELFDELYRLDDELRKKDKEMYESGKDIARPPKQDFEYQEIDKTTDDEIKSEVSGKYEKGDALAKEGIESDYANKLSKEDEKKLQAAEAAKAKEADAVKAKEKGQEEFKNKAIKSGIVESSIVGSVNEELEGVAGEKIEGINRETQGKIDGIDGQIEYLNTLKDQSLAKHDNNMASKVNGEIEKLIGQRDKLVQSQKDANKKTDYNKEKYEKSIATAEGKFDDKWREDMSRRDENEAKTGYYGERKENFDKRLDLAVKYLSQYPKEVAQQLIDKDANLKKLVGNNLYKLRKAVNDR